MLKFPLLRGIVSLFEALRIGYSSLQWSSEMIVSNVKNYNGPSKITDVVITVFSLFIALGLFFVAPIGITSWLFNKDQDPLTFNLISGLF